MMSISASVELVGVRDFAKTDPDDFVLKITSFYREISRISRGKNVVFEKNRENCQVVGENLDDVLFVLSKVRKNVMLRNYMTFKAIVVDGDILSDEIKDYKGGNVSARAYGLKEYFKGVGIYIDKLVQQQTHSSSDVLFKNYFITSSVFHGYKGFVDVKMDKSFFGPELLSSMFATLSSAMYTSLNLARYFIPMFINYAKNMDFSQKPEDADLDVLLTQNDYSKYKDVKGWEIVYLTLLDRVFYGKNDEAKKSQFKNKTSKNRRDALRKCFAKNDWLHSVLTEELYKHKGIPNLPQKSSLQAFSEYQFSKKYFT